MFDTKANIQDIYHNVDSFLCIVMIDHFFYIGPSFVISPSPQLAVFNLFCGLVSVVDVP